MPAKTPMAMKPRPVWNPAWAVRTGDENHIAESLHIDGRKLSFGDIAKNPKEAKGHLDDWDVLLLSSSLACGADPRTLMSNVKALFMTSGYISPRSTVGFSDALH